MAHNITIPIAFEFCPLKAHWTRTLESSSLWGDSKEIGDLLQPAIGLQQAKKPANAWTMRQEFFVLKRGDTRALLDFLNKWGWWRECALSELPMLQMERAVPAAKFWDTQERFRQALTAPIMGWLYKRLDKDYQIENQDHNMLLRTHLYPNYPYHRVRVFGCEPAMLMTITIDLLNQVKFRICARKDCGTPFALTDPRKVFCCQYCGHIESVRNNRKGKHKPKGTRHATRKN